MIGATSDEVEAALRRTHQTISPRFTELRGAGYIRYLLNGDGMRIRRVTRSGSGAYVHVATAMGIEMATLGLPIRIAGDATSKYHRGNPMSKAAFAANDRASLLRDVLKYVGSKSG
jgi:hypothetical protein